MPGRSKPASGAMAFALSVVVGAFLAALSPTPARAQGAELIHSDAPLWRPGRPNVWPQNFMDADSLGCTHRLRLGVWRYKTGDNDRDDEWYNLGNYGYFHCWMNVAVAYEPDSFGDSRPGFLIELGRLGSRELWALQTGARPGSDYILLARPTGAGVIERFEVLQRRCPAGHMRGGQALDIILTRYCSINSKPALLALARQMATLPDLGVMAFEREAPPQQ